MLRRTWCAFLHLLSQSLCAFVAVQILHPVASVHRLVSALTTLTDWGDCNSVSSTLIWGGPLNVPSAVQPQQLEDNLSELELMLADSQVRSDPKLWDTNQTSLKTLHSFLKAYTKRLKKVDVEYLEPQRHTLEFIIRYAPCPEVSFVSS